MRCRLLPSRRRCKLSLREAAERDDVVALPSGIFLAAFVRTYATRFGLQPDPVVLRFLERSPDPLETCGRRAASTCRARPPQAPGATRFRYLFLVPRRLSFADALWHAQGIVQIRCRPQPPPPPPPASFTARSSAVTAVFRPPFPTCPRRACPAAVRSTAKPPGVRCDLCCGRLGGPVRGRTCRRPPFSAPSCHRVDDTRDVSPLPGAARVFDAVADRLGLESAGRGV